MKCGTCGSERMICFYNGRIQEHWRNTKELITYCEYCRTTTTKKEVI